MNLELVEQIVSVLGEYPVSEITVERDGQRVSVCRPLTASVPPARPEDGPPPASQAASPEPGSETEAAAPAPRTLTATMVGIFHHADPPVPYAAVIAPGQRVGFIESMKLMNDVLAETGGRVTEVLVEDGAPVEYGQSLFRLVAE